MKKITFLMSFLTLLSWQGMSQFTEGFEGVGTPAGWTVINNNLDAELWYFSTPGAGVANGGTQVARIDYNASVNHDDYLVTPQINIVDQNTDRLTLYAKSRSTSFLEDFNILISTTGIAVGDFSTQLTPTITAPGTWTEYQYDLSAYEGQNIYIAFQAISLNEWELYIDDVTIDGMPACPDPSALTASNILATSADLGWTDNASASAWDIEYGATPFTPTGNPTITGTATNPHNLTGLTANTSYEYYVRADCGVDSSNWVGPFAFTTACNAFPVPFVENFNSTSTTQSCWTVINNNGDGDLWNMDYTSNPLNGDEVAVMYTDINSGANDDYLVTPTLTLTGNERLRFHYRVQSAGEPNDFQVTLSTTGVGVGNFINTLMPLDTVSNTTYQEQIIDLSAYTGNVNIAFHIPNGGLDGWRLYIDSVVVEAIPACLAPSALTATNISATSVDLGWTENGTATQWDIEWDTAGFTPGTGNMITGTTTNPHNLTGLTANTSYEFYVRADCGVDSSSWTGPFAFTTPCTSVIAAWTDSVELHTTSLTITTSNCWTATASSTYDWNIDDNGSTPSTGTGPLGANSGVKYFYTEATNGVAGDSAILTSPLIDITALSNPIIEYYYHMFGDNNGVMGNLYVEVFDGATWTLVDSLINEQQTAQADPWLMKNIDISSFSGTIQVRFIGVRLGAQYGDICLDDIAVKETPACPFPSNLTATNITSSSADLGWTENGSATQWDIEYGITPFTPTGIPTVTGTTTNPHNVSGLTANSTYEYYVRADCGVDSSIWIGPFAFSTPCATYVAPYLEQFNVASLPACWSQSGATTWEYGSVTGTTPAGFADYGANAVPDHSSPATGTFIGIDGSDNTDGEVSVLLSPFIDASPLTTPHLSYWVFSNNVDDAAQNKLIVELWDGAAWNFIDSIQSNLGSGWVNFDTVLTSLAITGDVQVRFTLTGVSNGGDTYYNDILIDDVQIYEPLTNDIGVIAIESTPTGCGLGNETVTIKVKNYGATAETGFDVVYTLNSVAITPETVSATVNPGDTLTYVFTTLANMSTPAVYTIDAWTDLTTDGDNNNDTLNGWMTEHLASSLAFSGAMAIPDNNTVGLNSIICTNGLVNNMLDSCYSLSALVIDSLTHTFNGDLEIWLISPANDTLEVSTDNGGTTDNYINVTFTDTASTNINGNNPVPGFYHTEELAGLAKFNGTNPNGAWTLLVKDDAGGDVGVLYDWHLEFTDHNFIVDLGADTNICSVDPITLNAGAGNYSYSWSTGDITQQVTLDTNTLGGNGTYNIVVTVTDTISGCQSIDTIVVNYAVCTGINALANNVNVNVYPNPNNGQFTLNVNTTDVNELSIRVVNIQGQEVYNRNNFKNLNTVNEQIDLSNNANGIYFVIVTTDKGIVTHKMIVQ
jgi:subtilisin-like proprotein convertase family protein